MSPRVAEVTGRTGSVAEGCVGLQVAKVVHCRACAGWLWPRKAWSGTHRPLQTWAQAWQCPESGGIEVTDRGGRRAPGIEGGGPGWSCRTPGPPGRGGTPGQVLATCPSPASGWPGRTCGTPAQCGLQTTDPNKHQSTQHNRREQGETSGVRIRPAAFLCHRGGHRIRIVRSRECFTGGSRVSHAQIAQALPLGHRWADTGSTVAS